MGLTFVAAGVSVPDALSSLAVVKEGNVHKKCKYNKLYLHF
jgi:Ca2+/Na+ antiporter